MKLSICLATYNEERNIKECLDSIKNIADEIIIVDGESTDKTVEICKSYKCRVYHSANNPIFHIQKQNAIDKCKFEWILQLDADERATPELIKEIKEILSNDSEFNGFWINRRKQFLGQWIKKGGHYPDPVIRFFRNGKGNLPQKSVHEQMVISGAIGRLKGELIHLPTPSFSVYLTKDNRYSTLMGLDILKIDPGTSLLSMSKYLLLAPIKTFLTMYFRHQGFRDGFAGFVFAFYSGLTQVSAYIKYWEIKHNPDIVNQIKQDWV